MKKEVLVMLKHAPWNCSSKLQKQVIRDDGSRCSNIKYTNISTEASEILKLFLNWKMLLIATFSIATNSTTSMAHSSASGLEGSTMSNIGELKCWDRLVGIGYILNFSFSSRRTRGFVGIGVVAVLGRPDSGSAFPGPFVLYFSYGLLDAMFQSMVYWVIGALADDSETLSRYSGFGFYKGVESAGVALASLASGHPQGPIFDSAHHKLVSHYSELSSSVSSCNAGCEGRQKGGGGIQEIVGSYFF
ncbi:hypothetical protein SAY86_026923 [Trapa natans]|uniref:Uncharacterized protein n=1 Tax=Trapa natans TaxID=22666 RepID=A0AAN7KQ74_TRANT|nr:hypothetical protein SAY86_026923 [Trapa natans]